MITQKTIKNLKKIIIAIFVICSILYAGDVLFNSPVGWNVFVTLDRGDTLTLPGGKVIYDNAHPHQGTDFAPPAGTTTKIDVHPCANGYISDILYDDKENKKDNDYGNSVEITHEDGSKTRYSHLKEITEEIKKKYEDYKKSGNTDDAKVDTDTVLGEMGNTGRSSKKHLDVEYTTKDGKKTDVRKKIEKDQKKTFKVYKSENINDDGLGVGGGGGVGSNGGTGSSSGTTGTPGGDVPRDHPDESFSIAYANYPSQPDLAYYLPLARKKSKKLVVAFGDLIEKTAQRTAYYQSLSDGQIPDESYVSSLDTEIWSTYTNLDSNQEALVEEFRTTPDVGILGWGFYNASSAMVSGFKESSVFMSYNFNPENWKDIPILIIPTAGLTGLDNSLEFKSKISQYASNGGTVVMLGQQHGYEFKALPGGAVNGYGWTEDQGCFTDAFYIDKQHQVLSGQTNNRINAAVDGYFSAYPEGAEVLLRRTKNAEAGMIMYPYGSGRVIATTMYEDWGSGMGQSTTQGRALMRDIVSWAKKAVELPEVNAGQSININVEIKNNSDEYASGVKIIIRDPNKNIVKFTNGVVSLSQGTSTTLPVTYTSMSRDMAGIWSINYELLDAYGKIIQGDTEGEKFVVKQTVVGEKPNSNFLIWGTVNSEFVTIGSTVVLTVHVKNNTNFDLVDGAIKITDLNGLGISRDISDIDLTANSEQTYIASFNIPRNVLFSMQLFRSNNGNNIITPALASGEKGVWSIPTQAGVIINLEKNVLAKNETVKMNVNIKNTNKSENNINDLVVYNMRTYILDPENNNVFDINEDVSFGQLDEINRPYEYIIPQSSVYGNYLVYTDLYVNLQKIGGNSTYFSVPDGIASIIPTFPAEWKIGDNQVSFLIANSGLEPITNGKFDLKLFIVVNTWTREIFNTVFLLNLQPNTSELKTLNIPLSYSQTTSMNYVYSYGDKKIVGGNKKIPFEINISASTDKNKYNILDKVKVDIVISNYGKIFAENNDVYVTIGKLDSNYVSTYKITLPAGTSSEKTYYIDIPDTVEPDSYYCEIEFRYGYKGDLSYKTENTRVSIVIPDYKLKVNVPILDLSAGQSLLVEIENEGGVNFIGKTEFILRDKNGYNIKDTPMTINWTQTDPLKPGKQIKIITIPHDAVSGKYILDVICQDTKKDKPKVVLQKSYNIVIQGTKVNIKVDPNKLVYRLGEDITAITNFDLINGDLIDAKLVYEISQDKGVAKKYTGIGLSDVTGISTEANGNVWFSLSGGGVVCYNGVDWIQYTVRDGLPSNSVQCIFIDNDGNKWFGTNAGLSRFNGTSFRNYTIKDGLTSNDIVSVFKDNNGVLWASTYEGGLNQYSGSIWYQIQNSGIGIQDTKTIWNIIKEKNGNRIWLATNDGAIRYNGSIWDVINNDNISCVYPDSKGNVWFGTWGNGIIKLEGNSCKNIGIINGLSNLFIRDIKEDNNNNIWVGTEKGLNKIDGIQNTIIKKYFKEDGLVDNKINSLGIDSNNNLWVGTKKGVSKFNNASWISYDVIPNKSGPLGQHIFTMYSDNVNLLLGTESGLTKFDALGNWTNFNINGLTKNHITSIVCDLNNNLWVGTWGGGFFTFPKTSIDNSSFTPTIYKKNAYLYSNYINFASIIPDKERSDTKCFGTWGAGEIINKPLTCSQTTFGENVWSGVFDKTREAKSNGFVNYGWLGSDTGLFRCGISVDGDKLQLVKQYTMIDGLPKNKITAIAMDKDNRKWIGTWGGGVSMFNDISFINYTKMDGLGSNYINNIVVDDKGKVWCGTNDGGVSVYDGKSWNTVDYGLPDNTVFSILPSQQYSNWIGTYGGLVQGMAEGKQAIVKQETINVYNDYNLTSALGALLADGKVYLKTKLYNKDGQLVSQATNSFDVIGNDQQRLLVDIKTDKNGYKPGSPINVSGFVKNITTTFIEKAKLEIKIDETGEIVYSKYDFPIQASSSFDFNFDIKNTNYTFTLRASASASPEVTVYQQVIIVEPELKANLIMPEIVDRKSFTALLKLENIGKIDLQLKCNFMDSTEDIFIPAEQTELLTRNISIKEDTNVVCNITGDLDLEVKKKVVFGEKININFTAQQEYEEGNTKIPYVLNNIGQIDSEIETEFNLVDSRQNTVKRENKTLYIPVGQNISGDLQFSLVKGEYELEYKNYFDSGKVSFKVMKNNDLEMNVQSDSITSSGKINLSVDINNLGINEFSGTLLVESPFSRNQENITIGKGLDGKYNFLLTPVGLVPGQSEITVSVLYAGNVLLQKKISSEIFAPTFEFVSIPQSPVYRLGKTETMSFTVKNTGNLQGETEVKLSILDVLDNSQKLWLASGEEKIVTFEFTIPDDMEEKEHKAKASLQSLALSLQPITFDIPFKLEGIKINVTASFDKLYYSVGEIARLTIDVENQDTTYMPNMFAKVNYHAYDSSQNFILVDKNTITFDVPVDKFNGEKVFYGIYMASGRSIWLNTIYLYEQKDILNLTTDKQVYKPGETVQARVTSMYPGKLTYSMFDSTGNIEVNGSAAFSFVLPQKLTAGTYGINYTYNYELSGISNQVSGTLSYDIDGISIKIIECNLDKEKYNSNDIIKTYLSIESNVDINTKLNAEVISPDNQSKSYVETYVALTKGDNKVNLTGSLSTQVPGIHRLSYRLYDLNEELSLSGGQEAFDVGDMVLTGFSADKYDYPEGYETVYITANFYSQGQNTGNFKITNEPSSIIDEQVTVIRFENKIYKITPSETGDIKLVGELENGSLKSTKEISFAYGSNLPDLEITNFSFNMPEEFGDEEASLTIGVRNSGKTRAEQFIVETQNFASLLENVTFNPLNPNYESTIIYKLNVKGITSLQLNAKVDRQDAIREFHENNNDAQEINVTIPIPPQINSVSAYTKDTTFVITGKGTAGAQAVIYLNSKEVTTASVTQQGDFTVSISPIEGENSVWARTVDENGNKSLWSNKENFIRDTKLPVITVAGVELNKYYNVDKQASISITDKYLDSTKTIIKLNGNVYKNGENISNEGSYSLYAKAEDLAGNKEDTTIIFTVDKTAPEISISGIENGKSYNTDVVAVISVDDINLKTSWINLNNQAYISGTTITEDNSYVLQANANDLAGNITTKEISFTIDKTAPNAPIIQNVTELTNNPKMDIKGNSEAQLQVSLYVNNNMYDSSVVSQSGEFTFANISLIEGENTFYAIAQDIAGNRSAESNNVKIVLDTIAPQTPSLISPQDGAIIYSAITTLKGTSEPNSKVIMKIGNTSHTVNADEDGDYIFSFIKLEENLNIIKISAEDKAGNVSSAIEARVTVKTLDLYVNKNILNTPRVLILEVKNPITNTNVIKNIFESTGINYTVADTKEKFRNELRTNKYNVYMLMGNDKDVGLIVEKELKGRVYGGDGLVVSGEKIGVFDNLQEVLGVKNEGYLSSTNNVVNFEDTTFTKQNTFSSIGKAERIKLINGQKLGYISLNPSAAHNGKINSIKFDLNYQFVANRAYSILIRVYDGNLVIAAKLQEEVKVTFNLNEIPKEFSDYKYPNKSVNLAVKEIDENKLRFILESNVIGLSLRDNYTIFVGINKVENGREIPLKVIGPLAIKVDKCLIPKEGDIFNDLIVSEIAKEGLCEVEQEEPAVIVNNYGQGKVVLFTADLLKSNTAATKSQIREILLNSIKYVAPETIDSEPLGIVPVGINIENKGKEINLKVTEIIPDGTKSELLLQSKAWQFKLLEKGKKDLTYYLSLPNTKGTFTPTSEIEYLDYDSSYKWYGKYTVDLTTTYTLNELANEIINDLNSLNLLSEDNDRRKQIKTLINKIITIHVNSPAAGTGSIDITYCLRAIDILTKIKSSETVSIRIKMIKLLKLCEAK